MKIPGFLRILDFLPFLRKKRPKREEIDVKVNGQNKAPVPKLEMPPRDKGNRLGERRTARPAVLERRKPRNKVFESHRSIRDALRELRDIDQKILEYEEEIKPSSLLYRLTIRKDKPVLTVQFIRPRENWVRYESAQSLQIFLKSFLPVLEIKKIVLRKVNNRLKGWEAEDAVVAAAKDLAGKPGKNVVDAYHASGHEDGRKQTDVIIASFFENVGRHETPLQVKTSLKGQEKHIADKGGRKIPSILYKRNETRESLQEKIILIRNAYYERDEVLHL